MCFIYCIAVEKIGGVFGLIAAICAFYAASANLLKNEYKRDILRMRFRNNIIKLGTILLIYFHVAVNIRDFGKKWWRKEEEDNNIEKLK